MISDNDKGLYDNIMTALNKVANKDMWQQIDTETGSPIGDKEDLYPYNADDLNKKYQNMGDEFRETDMRVSNYTSAVGVPNEPLFQDAYIAGKRTGTEAMIEIIGKEVLNYITEYAEVSFKPRLDKLEEDYNNLLQAINNAGTDIAAVTTEAITNLDWDTSGTGGGIYNIRWDTIDVIEPSVLGDIIDAIATAGGGPTRKTDDGGTLDLSATNEVQTINGIDYTIQIT